MHLYISYYLLKAFDSQSAEKRKIVYMCLAGNMKSEYNQYKLECYNLATPTAVLKKNKLAI